MEYSAAAADLIMLQGPDEDAVPLLTVTVTGE
jgi:hypothetical protein